MKKESYDRLTDSERVFADLLLETNDLLRKLNRAIDIEVKDDATV